MTTSRPPGAGAARRPEEAEPWAQRAECTVRAEADLAAALAVHYIRGRVELARGRDADALAAFRAAERLDGLLDNSHLLITRTRAFVLTTLVRLGDTERAERILAALGEQDRRSGEVRTATAGLRLAQDDPQAQATANHSDQVTLVHPAETDAQK